MSYIYINISLFIKCFGTENRINIFFNIGGFYVRTMHGSIVILFYDERLLITHPSVSVLIARIRIRNRLDLKCIGIILNEWNFQCYHRAITGMMLNHTRTEYNIIIRHQRVGWGGERGGLLAARIVIAVSL